MPNRNVSVMLNGVPIEQLTLPEKNTYKNFIDSYQILISSVIIALAIAFHALWIGTNQSVIYNICNDEEESDLLTPPSVPLVVDTVNSPWENRLVLPVK